MSSPSLSQEWCVSVNGWKFRPRAYPHFDHAITHPSEALALIKEFQETGTHSFLPFLESPLELRRFSKYLEKMRKVEAGNDVQDFAVNKPRPIKYAAHTIVLSWLNDTKLS